jgi:protein phosphatase 2C family protein 2/3
VKNLTVSLAEFRGPGARHQFDQDSPDDYELDVPRYRGGRNGRIILLGDGTEVLTDSTDDAEMFDHSMEDDKDEENQIKKASSTTSENESTRKDREGTPGPQSEAEKEHMKHGSASQGPETSIKGVADDPDNTK